MLMSLWKAGGSLSCDRFMIVTIDGPAGAGKSTVARQLAERLGFEFLDTGAMYRAAALAVMNAGKGFDDAEHVESVVAAATIDFADDYVLLDGHDVTQEIRTPEVTSKIRYVADNAQVRQRMVSIQRTIGNSRDTVTEGRDQGTVAFPNAACKIFLTASPEERARRRVADLAGRGLCADYETVLAQQQQRDEEDQSRKTGALRKADDAVELTTDGLSLEAVVDQLEAIVRQKMPAGDVSD